MALSSALGWGKRQRQKGENVEPPPLPAPPGPDTPRSTHSEWRRADPYAFQAVHTRLAWMLRLSVVTNVSLAAVVVVGAGAFSALMPLKEIRPMFIRSSEAEDRIYRVEPLEKTVKGFDLVLETMAKRYVRLLLEIDTATQAARFNEAWAMSTPDYYKRFKKERIDTKELDKALESGLVRQVLVETANRVINPVTEAKGVYVYAVNFTQIDRRAGKEVERKELTAYLQLTTEPHAVPIQSLYENPLGVRVIDLVLKDRATD